MLAITNGTVHTLARETHEHGMILIDAGKNVAVGERLTVPSDATVVDATGKIVLPGFVESHSHVGVWGDGVAGEGHDFNETSDPVTPHMRAIEGLNPGDGAFRDVLAAGITTLLTGAGSANLFGGEWVAIKPVGRIVEEMVIEHATEGWKIADFLAREQVPVSLGPFHLGRPKIEMAPMTLEAPGILARAGVTVAIHMDATAATAYLPVFAGLAVRAGLDEDEALKAITINAARISGIADRVGSLEPGKDADVLVLSGHPFDWKTTVERVYIDGALAHVARGIVA